MSVTEIDTSKINLLQIILLSLQIVMQILNRISMVSHLNSHCILIVVKGKVDFKINYKME